MEIRIRSPEKVRALLDPTGFSGHRARGAGAGGCVGQSSLGTSGAGSGEGSQLAGGTDASGRRCDGGALGPWMEPQGRERDARLDVEAHSHGRRVEGPSVGASGTHQRRQGGGGRPRWMEAQAGSRSREAPECCFRPQPAARVLSTQPHQDGPQRGPRRCRLRGSLRALRRVHSRVPVAASN